MLCSLGFCSCISESSSSKEASIDVTWFVPEASMLAYCRIESGTGVYLWYSWFFLFLDIFA